MAEGCYVPQYIPASFKGIPFDALEVTSEHGRRGAEGEFPFGEYTAYADLGRRIRTYRISGRLVQNAHIAHATALIIACETPGPGILLHPTRGAVQVACKSLSVKDNPIEEQGVTYVDMEFVEANDWTSGLSIAGGIFSFTLTAISLAVFASFQSRYTPNTVRYYRTKDVLATSSEAMGEITREFVNATKDIQDTRIWRAISDLEQLQSDPAVLRDPDRFEQAISLGMAAIDKYTLGLQKFSAFRRIANWASQSSPYSGEVAETQDSVYATFRILSAAYMARGLSEEDPSTLLEALSQNDAVMSILEQEMAVAHHRCDDCLYLALSEFKTQVEKTLLHRAYNLPPVVRYNFSAGVHSLVAAYEIFGDAKRHRVIETRNPSSLPFQVGPVVIASRAA